MSLGGKFIQNLTSIDTQIVTSLQIDRAAKYQ
jgi:hypothetical protein